MKNMLAAPPNTLRINEKYINEYYPTVPNDHHHQLP
jgi:hypothetical protein